MSNPAAETALGPMVIVATEQYLDPHQRIVEDALAAKLLPSNLRAMVGLARWKPLRDLLLSASEKRAPGITGSVLCRKRFVADQLAAALPGLDAIVVLGAGLDTLGSRLAGRSPIPVYEVDLPENIAVKEERLRAALGHVPETVRLCPMDFEHQELESVLRARGHRAEDRTLFIWEAVTQYLTESAIRKTLGYLQKAATGSRLVFTYVRQDFIDGTNLYGAGNLYNGFRVKQQIWRFGFSPDQVAPFLADYGWHEVEQMGRQAFLERYVAPAGRDLNVSEIERSVYAEKL